MDVLAPPVVAVLVAHDPGPWFDETLASLAEQDYAELSVLVLDSASPEDLTTRVAAVLPSAYVRRFETRRSFGSTANEAITMVEGAAFLLLLHDDVALDPDAVHLLVEEAFRSNAGVVAAKVVAWDDERQLLHVGMAVDKGGSVVDRVQPREIDHGQHDAVRDVFVAPGGCTLIRADLFAELGGFDPAIVAMGEDLDLCWRAQVAGARVIVAPDARVRHAEVLAGGARSVDPSLAPDDDPERPPTLQELQRRHELLAVLKCYGPFHLARILPQLVFLSVSEFMVAELAGNRARARAVARAWRWNLSRLGQLRAQRASLRSHRRVPDREIRQLQLRGSARTSSYGRRLFLHGFHGAHADELAAADPLPTAVVLPSRIHDAAPDRGRVGRGVRTAVWLAVAVGLVIGTRGVLTGHLPSVGQFTPFPGWWSVLSAYFGGWHPSGVGTTAPSSPALAIIGVTGTVLLGAMGLAQKLLVFGCLPLGAWGVVRLLRPFGSARAALVAGVSYLAVPLPYDDLAVGRWSGLVAYAGAPWVVGALCRAGGSVPFGPSGGRDDRQGRLRGLLDRHQGAARLVALGVLEAVLTSFAPTAALVVALVALVLAGSGVLVRAPGGARILVTGAGATAVAALLLLPWLLGVVVAGRSAWSVFGPSGSGAPSPSFSSLLRLTDGPIGRSPLVWGVLVAALVPLVLGRGPRLAWAVRLWWVAIASWVLAWASVRGWTGDLTADPLVLLAPAAVAVAAAVGLGVAAFEEDLPAAVFGWRQVVSTGAAVLLVVSWLPQMVSAIPGRWDLPTVDVPQTLSWMPAQAPAGAFRVLWLGDPRSLLQGSWPAGNGLAYATSEDGTPDVRWEWNAAAPGPATTLAAAVTLARQGRTDRVGSLLADAGVRYVVLLGGVAPDIAGDQSPPQFAVPTGVLPALERQLDLRPVLTGGGIEVYQNLSWNPIRAEVAGPVTASSTSKPVLPGPVASRSYAGPVSTGTVLAAEAPSGRWTLSAGRATVRRIGAPGWTARFAVTGSGRAVLHFDGGGLGLLADLWTALVWSVTLAFVAVRLRRPVVRRVRSRTATGDAGA